MHAALEGRRSSVIIASKLGIPLDEHRKGGARPEYIRRAVEDSLKRLGTDYIDLYQLHRPDPEVPIADTQRAPTNTRLSPSDSPLRGRFLSDDKVARAEALAQLAEARGHTLLELAFSWLAARAVVSSIIAGATSAEQVRANAAATGWKLSADELLAIDRLTPASST